MKKRYRINYQIKSNTVRLVDQKGASLGIVSIKEAREKAQEKGLDLVEIASNTDPPVVKLLRFRQFLREQEKQRKKAVKKSELKELRVSPNIGEADLRVREKRARTFLRRGDQVKFTVIYRGRENVHPEGGEQRIEKLIKGLSDVSKVVQPPKKTRNILTAVLAPKVN